MARVASQGVQERSADADMVSGVLPANAALGMLKGLMDGLLQPLAKAETQWGAATPVQTAAFLKVFTSLRVMVPVRKASQGAVS